MLQGKQKVIRDATLCVIIAVAAVLMYWSSFALPPPALEPIGPAAFPRWVATLLLGLALIILGSHFLPGKKIHSDREGIDQDSSFIPRYDLLIWLFGLTLLYFLAMQYEVLGFRWATVVYAFALTIVLFDWAIRALVPAALCAIALGFGIHWIFTRFLFVDLP